MTTHDVIVLGGGPAGLTAGIYLARAKVRALVVDPGMAGGQMILSYEIANYPGVPDTSGPQLAMLMKSQAKSFGCEVLDNSAIERSDLISGEKLVEVEDEGVFTAPAIIVAPGGVPRTLGLPNEANLKGRGISYCATCDGDFFTGQKIAVIGGGNSALEEAVALTKYASSVTVIHEFDHFQAQPWAIEQAKKNPKIKFLMEQDIREFVGDNSLEKVVVSHKKTGDVTEVDVTGCFIFIGYVPNTSHLKGILDLNERGEIVCDDDLNTSLPGVFAAGDARVKKVRQITTAVADGTIAALSALDFLRTR